MADFYRDAWDDASRLSSKAFRCWNCGNTVASYRGYQTVNRMSKIYICPHCNAPHIVDEGNVEIPSALPSRPIQKLPKNVEQLYNEARICCGAGAYTATVMLLRKLLMNLAVTEGAATNLKFFQYVEYLCSEGLIHKRQHRQAGEIKDLGNAANHEIESRTMTDAQKILNIMELILINNYEQADPVEEPKVVM